MIPFALGILVLLGTLLLGLTLGIGVSFGLAAAGVEDDLARSIGLVGVWWLSAIVLFGYANIWLDPFGRLSNFAGDGSSPTARERSERPKAQTAAIRGAAMFAMIGGLTVRSQSPVVIIAVALGCGVLGWLFGADYRRRVNRSPDRGDQSSSARSSNHGKTGQRPREGSRR